MKPEKVFVRYKNLNEPPYPRERQERPDKRAYQKKKYAEKFNKPRQPFKIIYQSFTLLTELPQNVQRVRASFPSFFNAEGKTPEKDSNQLLNDYLIFNTKKFLQSLKEPKKDPEPMSESDPDWNSDEDIDCNMESKVIEEVVVEKIVEKMKDKPIKKPDNLKPHEKRFLEDYFRSKRHQEENENQEPPVTQKREGTPSKKPQSPSKPASVSEQIKSSSSKNEKEEEKSKPFWSEYQERQVNTFVDMGFMTKIEENDDEMPIEVIEDDDMFNQDEPKEESEENSNKSSSEAEEDDIFGDQTPTTTVKAKQQISESKPQSQKKITQGTVFINERIFSNIAQSVGLLPARCNWIIKNETNKYKVSTDYMDAYYRKEKMYEILPLISLNHSVFVSNQLVGTAEALQKFRDFNYRRGQQNNQNHYPQRHKYQYKQKQTHLKKK